MTVEQAIRDRLAAVSAVTALVSTRVYQLRLPQRVDLPAIRVQFIGVVDFFHLRGGSLVERSRVQVDAYAQEASGADPYARAAAVADAVHQALNGITFETTDLSITGVMRAGRQALYDAAELREVRILQDYIVWSKRAA